MMFAAGAPPLIMLAVRRFRPATAYRIGWMWLLLMAVALPFAITVLGKPWRLVSSVGAMIVCIGVVAILRTERSLD